MITSGSSVGFRSYAALTRCLGLLLPILLVLATPAAAALNLAYLVPGSGVKVNKQFRTSQAPLKICALTFDDGPDETYTMQVMQTLDRLQVRATFFVVGDRVEEFPEQVRLLAKSGHEIGNHTYSHPDMAQLGKTSQRKQIEKTSAILGDLGIRPRWFRPPYGSASRTTINLAEDLGMDVVRWSVDPRDWAQPGVKTIAGRISRETCPGAVVLMHSTNAQTLAALPGVIADLRSRGYTFVTMSQWKDVVTGRIIRIEELQPFVPQFTEITTIAGLPDPFYHPYGTEQVPEVFDELELLSPEDSAHAIWNDPATQLDAPVVYRATDQAAGLTVYSNFESRGDLWDVFSRGGSRNLFAVYSILPAGKQPAVDPPVNESVPPPSLPQPEQLEIPPAPTLAPFEPEPMPLREFRVDSTEHPLPWAQPELIRTSSLAREDNIDGNSVQKLFLLVRTNRKDPTYWQALDEYALQARIDGLVFPTATFFGNPPAALACPWTFAGPQITKDIPVVALDDHPSYHLLALGAAGISSVLVEAPADTGLLEAKPASDLILLRQLTAGLPSIPRPVTTAAWQLPDGVLMCCFGDGDRTTIILANNSDGSLDMELGDQSGFLSFASWSGTEAITLEPVNGHKLYTGSGSILVLYHDRRMGGR